MFTSWLNHSVSPYHTVEFAEKELLAHGFTKLETGGDFDLKRGGRYVVRNGTFLTAFTIGTENIFHIAAAHTDWPCMRIKPSPEQVTAGCCKLAVEAYGGAILSTWLDRPLSMAGVVMVRGKDPMHPESRLVRWEESLLTIPNVAIHLNREVNKGVAIRPNVDMLPICGLVGAEFEKDNFLLKQLAKKLEVSVEDILSYELCAYLNEKAETIGFDGALLSSPRIDNVSSVHAIIESLIASEGSGINIATLFDHEEIGSNTYHGGDSITMTVLLEKIALSLGLDRATYLNARLNGMLLSCDVAHAMHPNHPEYADAANAPKLGSGVALKRSPRYSSDAQTCAIVTDLCRSHDIPLQSYMNRADLPGGGTIGSMASALLAMPAADVGVPILAMHSAREVMAARDQEALVQLVTAFFH